MASSLKVAKARLRPRKKMFWVEGMCVTVLLPGLSLVSGSHFVPLRFGLGALPYGYNQGATLRFWSSRTFGLLKGLRMFLGTAVFAPCNPRTAATKRMHKTNVCGSGPGLQAP